MNKLIKSDYYYIIDDKAVIEAGNYCFDKTVFIAFSHNIDDCNKYAIKVIATNNPSISLPQITNASDELELLIGKEIEIEFKTIEVSISSHDISYAMYKGEPDTEEKDFAIIKPISKSEIIENHCKEKGINFINIPISKETSTNIVKIGDKLKYKLKNTDDTKHVFTNDIVKIISIEDNEYVAINLTVMEEEGCLEEELAMFPIDLYEFELIKETSTNESLKYEPDLFNDNSTVTFTVKEVREISTNLLKEYDAKLTENPYNKGNFTGFWDYMKKNYRDRFINTSKTNETLEEVALRLSEQFEENKDGFEEQSDFYYGVKAGYKHAEKTMIKILLSYNEYLFTFIDSDNVGIDVSEQSVINWFNNKKITKI